MLNHFNHYVLGIFLGKTQHLSVHNQQVLRARTNLCVSERAGKHGSFRSVPKSNVVALAGNVLVQALGNASILYAPLKKHTFKNKNMPRL